MIKKRIQSHYVAQEGLRHILNILEKIRNDNNVHNIII